MEQGMEEVEFCRKGHMRTYDNTYYYFRDGHVVQRQCLKCRALAARVRRKFLKELDRR